MSHVKPTLWAQLRSKRAILIYVGTLLMMGVTAYLYFGQASPGDLSQAHAALSKTSLITDCKKCHSAEGLTRGCLSCHTEIQGQLTRQTGYHYFLSKYKKTDCALCHSEHNGREFALINKVSWGEKEYATFKHAHVKFTLVDTHAKLACAKCHVEKVKKPFSLPKFPKQARTHSYLGLAQVCTNCHADPHAGGRITDCTACHNQKRFKPAANFNHDKFFPLRGAHARTACIKCHSGPRPAANSSGSFKIFGSVKGKRCADCHGNPHRVNWKKNCQACHSFDQPWSNTRSKITPEVHALTGFRLAAPHHKVKCVSCHAEGRPYTQRFSQPRRVITRCQSCHKDPHNGQFAARFPHCTDCHRTQGFRPSKLMAKDHVVFPLIGNHAMAPCYGCHTREGGTGPRRFRGTPKDCAACHKEPHRGQFQVGGVTRCLNCHTSPKSWQALKFDHNKQASFKLDEAHANVACKECHPNVSLKGGARFTQYKPLRHECRDCHDFER